MISIECPGFASVKFDCASGRCDTEFGNGSVIECLPTGGYNVIHSGGGNLCVNVDGSAIYCPVHCTGSERCYVMRHCERVIVETVDDEGRHYNIKHTGETEICLSDGQSAINTGPSPELHAEQSEENDCSEDQVQKEKIDHPQQIGLLHINSLIEILLKYFQDSAQTVYNKSTHRQDIEQQVCCRTHQQ